MKGCIMPDHKTDRSITPAKMGAANINGKLYAILKWLDMHILPMMSIMVLAGLAVRGAQSYLQGATTTVQISIAIAAVSFFVVKAFQKPTE